MRIILIPILFILSFGCRKTVINGSVERRKPTTQINFVGKTCIFIGNSITVGTHTSSPSHRWTSLFCANKKAIEVNLGLINQTMQAGTCGPYLNLATIPQFDKSKAALFIDLGTNDVGRNNGNYSSTAFKIRYQEALDTAKARGWPASNIVLVNVYHVIDFHAYVGGCGLTATPPISRAYEYNAKVLELSNENGCRYVDVWSAMSGLTNEFFASDGLHPNDLGHAFIANYLIYVL